MPNDKPAQDYYWGPDAEELLDLDRAMRKLLDSAEWQALAAVGEKQAALRIEMLLMSSEARAARQVHASDEFLKGAIFGIRLLAATPRSIIEQATRLREERSENPQKETE